MTIMQNIPQKQIKRVNRSDREAIIRADPKQSEQGDHTEKQNVYRQKSHEIVSGTGVCDLLEKGHQEVEAKNHIEVPHMCPAVTGQKVDDPA